MPLLILIAVVGLLLAVGGVVSGLAGYGIALGAFAILMYREGSWG